MMMPNSASFTKRFIQDGGERVSRMLVVFLGE